jgi:hypothetical protein
MDTQQLQGLALRLAALTDALEQRSQQAVQQMHQSGERLQQVAQGLGLEGQRLAEQVVNEIGTRTHGTVEHGMRQGIEQCGQQLQQVAKQAAQTVIALQQQEAALERAQRGLLWKGTLALLVGSVLAAGGSAYFVWRSWQTLQQAQFSEALVQATRSGTLTQCGQILCAKAPKNAPRYEKNGDYVLLKD